MQIDIHLGQQGEYTLSYEFYDNPVARTIYQRMHDQPNEIIDRTIFKGFGETVEQLQEQLQGVVDQLQLIIPMEHTDVLDTNKLHSEFPKYNDLYLDDPDTLTLLRKFNTLIHHIEQISRYPYPAFQFACFDPGVDIKPEWYKLFTPFKRKGEMYMHYPHVGKHFLELFLDKDYDVLPEQIVLTQKIANTFSFWCGDLPPVDTNESWQKLETFFNEVKDKLPYEWGDPRLAIGYIPIGKYIGDIEDHIEEIAKHKYVHSWSLK